MQPVLDSTQELFVAVECWVANQTFILEKRW
jgi:hypothetical protein